MGALSNLAMKCSMAVDTSFERMGETLAEVAHELAKIDDGRFDALARIAQISGQRCSDRAFVLRVKAVLAKANLELPL